ncbi:MAG: DUF6873 family GME fold protein [Solirubrobacterales bacterium]
MNNFFVDYRISNEELINLKKFNINPIKCPKSHVVYEAINGHPDILLHPLGNKNILVHRDISLDFINSLKSLGYNLILSKKSLGSKYPDNIILNGLNFSDYFLHNLKYTDENLMNLIKNKILIDVKQGYTKCSCALMPDNSIITSDKGIYSALKNINADVLFIPPGDILLPGLDYGFIGGCCGAIDETKVAFFGDLSCYKYGNEVLKFLKERNLEPIFLKSGKLIDRGSLLKA